MYQRCSVQLEPEKVVIFDYDDTLFPKVLRQMDPNEIDPNELQQLDDLICTLLDNIFSKRNCSLFIVTNSKGGWIRKTSAQYLPNLHQFLETYNRLGCNLSVISSRSSYESMYPNEPITWKIHAFDNIMKDRTAVRNVSQLISFGDGIPEKIALLKVSKMYDVLGKSIQFLDSPKTILEIILQLKLVLLKLDDFLNAEEAINVNLTF